MALARGATTASFTSFVRNDTCATLLRLLAVEPVAWAEVAAIASREPLMSWALLSSQPLARKQLDRDLAGIIEARLIRLGADLLRAWLLLNRGGAGEDKVLEQAFGQSLLAAELTMHLAMEVRYRSPNDAYLAGLWHRLGALPASDSPAGQHDSERDAARLAMLGARLAARARPSPPLLDAIQLQGALEEHIAQSHTLARLLWVALQLADLEPHQHLGTLSRVSRLPESVLLNLRADVAYIAEGTMHPRRGAEDTAAIAAPVHGIAETLDDPWLGAATRAYIQGAFSDLGEDESRARLAAACRLLCACDGPRLIFEQERGRLLPLFTDDLDPQWLEGFELRLDDETSSLALALRTNLPARYHATRNGPGRSTIDWQLDRWLGGEGFMSLPWQSDGRRGVAVFETLGENPDPRLGQLLTALVSAAAGETIRKHRLAAEQKALQDSTREGFSLRARRIRHEVNNPLTIIRSYLDLVRERYPSDQQLDKDLGVVNGEIERIGTMLATLTNPAQTVSEPGFVSVNETLLDLQGLCEQSLFTARGIQFELRTARGLPQVAIAPSALTQIVLNLFRNASEALSPGHKVFVSTTGPLNVEGKNCVELRIIDNGPGMPPDKLKHLFAEIESDKGGGHEGIGLSIVRDLVRHSGGYILCRSQPGAGTAIQLFLPIHN